MIDPDLISEIKKLHWAFDWTGNWPLLDATLQRNEAYEKESRKICGIVLITKEITINENRTCTIYRAEEDFKEQAEYLKNKFKFNPTFIKKSARWYRFKVNRDLRALRKIRKIKNLHQISSEKLIRLFNKARGHFAYNAMIDIYDWFIEKVFTPILQEFLIKKLEELGKPEKIGEYIATLITPHKISVIFKERTMIFGIINYIRNNPDLLKMTKDKDPFENILNTDKKLKSSFENYFKKYLWMPCLVNNPPHTRETIWQEISHFIVNNEPLSIKTKRLGDNYDRTIINKSGEYIIELKPPKEIKYIVEGLRDMAFLRTEDYVVMSESTYCTIPLFTEIGKRLGISYYDLKEFLPEEIISHLKAERKITADVLEKRSAINCYVTFGDERLLFEGEEAKIIKETIEQKMRSLGGNNTEFKGTIGNRGRIKGRARVALNYQSVSEVKKDEILILASVSASFVPHLGKAAGIVAEFGGLTSHPVIVAREFNLPCLVGVKGITSILKDGDMVEVDADKGVVRKI